MPAPPKRKGDPCYRRHHDDTSNEPIRCARCNQLYTDTLSYRDHVLSCIRPEIKTSGKYHARQAKGIAT